MKSGENERQRLQTDITEAFDFVRFAIKHPATLRKIRNGAVIRLMPASGEPLPPSRAAKGVQVFAAETVYHYW